jgi:hypothetical protein
MQTDAGGTPNLLADYLYLRQTAVVRQAIETVRTSVSLGRLPDCLERQKRYPADTSNSTYFRLTRPKSALFQRLALQLRFAADKDSLPTDSGHFVRVLLDPTARLEPGARWVNS